jgi:hypothetical protein
MSSTIKKLAVVKTLNSTNATERGTFNKDQKGVHLIQQVRVVQMGIDKYDKADFRFFLQDEAVSASLQLFFTLL